MTVKFREVGNSITVTIPKQIVTRFGLEQGVEADVVEQDGENYLYVHCIDVGKMNMEKSGDEVKGAMEKWIRRIWE